MRWLRQAQPRTCGFGSVYPNEALFGEVTENARRAPLWPWVRGYLMKQMGLVQVRQVCCQKKKAQEPERTFLSDFAVRWMKMHLGLHLLYVKLMPVLPTAVFPIFQMLYKSSWSPSYEGRSLVGISVCLSLTTYSGSQEKTSAGGLLCSPVTL